MTDIFTQAAESVLEAATTGRIPPQAQALAEENITRAREACDAFSSAAKDAGRGLGNVVEVASKGARDFNDVVLANMTANTQAALDAASRMARAKSLPEVANLQMAFVQSQSALAAAQTRALFELSSRITRETFETFAKATQSRF